MASATWIKLPKSKGIEYYVATDGSRTYKLRALVNGKKYVDVIGSRTEDEAREIKALLDRNRKTGRGPQSYEEMIGADKAARKEEAEEREREKLNTIAALSELYLAERAKREERSQHDFKTIRGRHTKWIQPHFGDMLFSKLKQSHIEEFVSIMQDVPLSTKSIRENVAELGRLWKYAIRKRIVKNPNTPFPGDYVELPKLNNQRQAFLTWEQAQELLKFLDTDQYRETHDYCLLTLYTGMRPSEIHRLTWQQVETGFVFKTKVGRQRPIIFDHPEVVKMLAQRREIFPAAGMHDLVFPRMRADKNGNTSSPRKEALNSFDTAVRKLGFYIPIEQPKDKHGNLLPETPRAKADREQQNRINKIVFYSLRHTFASWLVQSGTPLYIVRDAMGHSTQKMTERYSHLAPSHIRNAVTRLPGAGNPAPAIEGKREIVDAEFSTVDG